VKDYEEKEMMNININYKFLPQKLNKEVNLICAINFLLLSNHIYLYIFCADNILKIVNKE